MSRKKNARAQARKEEERRTQTRRIRTIGVSIGMCLLGVAVGLTVQTAFGPQTCGNTDEDISTFLEEQCGYDVDLLKTAENGRVKAILYEREDLGGCVAFFERQLFGVRWRYSGMDTLKEYGLQVESSWHASDFLHRSKCEAIICGDNRSGEVGSYVLADAEGVARGDLESDYILDIYILDGASEMPKDFEQYAPDGTALTEGGK